MIHLTADTRILLATKPADFRSGIDGFVALCRHQLKQEPRAAGTLFVFINRRQTMVRVLRYDGTGFWLMSKRLSQGRFRAWPKAEHSVTPLAARQLKTLLTGHAGWQQL